MLNSWHRLLYIGGGKYRPSENVLKTEGLQRKGRKIEILSVRNLSNGGELTCLKIRRVIRVSYCRISLYEPGSKGLPLGLILETPPDPPS